MNNYQGCACPCPLSVAALRSGDKISTSPSHFSRDSKAANYLKTAPHPTRNDRYQLQICQGDRSWAYPIAWSWAELQALQMMARNSINGLDLSLDEKGRPKDSEALHGLIEKLFPSVARVAAMAQEVAA